MPSPPSRHPRAVPSTAVVRRLTSPTSGGSAMGASPCSWGTSTIKGGRRKLKEIHEPEASATGQSVADASGSYRKCLVAALPRLLQSKVVRLCAGLDLHSDIIPLRIG